MSRFENTQSVVEVMTSKQVDLGMIETWYFLDLFEDDLIAPREHAFDYLIAKRFEGAYTTGNADWWQHTADHARELLDEGKFLGEPANDNEDRYAMHLGIPYRLLTRGEVEAVDRAVRRFGGNAYQDGDNFFEWGESLLSVDEAAEYVTDEHERLCAASAHFVVYVNKGIVPEVVFEAVRQALPLVAFIPLADGHAGLPFYIDEAEVWGENVGDAWMTTVHSSNWRYRRGEA